MGKIKSFIKSHVLFVVNLFTDKRVFYDSEKCELLNNFSIKGKNVFFGYYDIEQENEKYILAHEVKANPNPLNNNATILMFNKFDKTSTLLTESNLWAWQQGSRLKWSNVQSNAIYFNDLVDKQYKCRLFDVSEKKYIKVIDWAIYDFNKDETLGVTCNFSRLQRLRPGYGYYRLQDVYANERAPKDDGVFLVDIKQNSRKLCVSLFELAKKVDPNIEFEHYINHLSFSPDGSKFIFFHIWNCKKFFGWMTNLYVYDLKTEKLTILEDKDLVSHYAWRNNNEVLITGKSETKYFYRIYNVIDGEKINLSNELSEDGHPSFLDENTFISDTYPNRKNKQKVFLYNIDNEIKETLVIVNSNPFKYGEKRCDLHPRLNRQTRDFIIDTTNYGRNRSMMLFHLK